jgi:ssDNA-binding replication factor A large subunit
MILFQEEAVHQVMVNSTNVQIKNIFIEDASKKCKVALWRSCVDQDVRPGDFVEITDVIVNNYRNELSLSTTSRTVITVSPIFSYELSIIVPYLEIIITIELQIKNKFLKD